MGFEIEPVKIVNAFVYKVTGSSYEGRGVLVISYLCKLLKKSGKFELVGEGGAAEFKKFDNAEISKLDIPEFYKTAIAVAKDELLKIKKFS